MSMRIRLTKQVAGFERLLEVLRAAFGDDVADDDASTIMAILDAENVDALSLFRSLVVDPSNGYGMDAFLRVALAARQIDPRDSHSLQARALLDKCGLSEWLAAMPELRKPALALRKSSRSDTIRVLEGRTLEGRHRRNAEIVRKVFGAEMPVEDLPVVLRVLNDQMSFRAIATLMSCITAMSYDEALYEAQRASRIDNNDSTVMSMRRRFTEHGF